MDLKMPQAFRSLGNFSRAGQAMYRNLKAAPGSPRSYLDGAVDATWQKCVVMAGAGKAKIPMGISTDQAFPALTVQDDIRPLDQA
jgi:hypothetical protein